MTLSSPFQNVIFQHPFYYSDDFDILQPQQQSIFQLALSNVKSRIPNLLKRLLENEEGPIMASKTVHFFL